MIPPARRTLSRGAATITVLGLLAATAACGGDDEPGAAACEPGVVAASPSDGPTTPPADTGCDQVTYLTGFSTFGRDAYAFVAAEKGYFAEEGIEVEVVPGDGTLPNITQVVEGEADFGTGDLTGILVAVGDDQVPPGSTVVAAVQQQTVFAIFALQDGDITNPQDLEGKTVADAVGSVGQLLFPTYAELANVDADQVDYDASFEPPNLPGLLAGGQADAITQFVVGEPTIEAAAGGQESVVLPFSDVLRDLYGNAIFTSTELAEDDPDLVQRFNRALMRGLEDAVADPAEAGRILSEAVPEVDPEVAAQELELMEAYVQPLDPTAPIGAVDDQRVSKSIAVLEGAGAIPEGVTPEDVVNFDLVPSAEDE